MTPQIDFSKPLKATTTDGGTVNFVINEKIPGQPRFSLQFKQFPTRTPASSLDSEIKKFECLIAAAELIVQ